MRTTLSRKTLLQGAGVALPLPFLDVMEGAQQNPHQPTQRFVALFKPNGVHPPTWAINNGKEHDFELSALMKPLEPHKKDLLVLDNMGTRHQAGHNGANFLCGVGRANGASMDQVLADHIGKTTAMKSLELTTEGIFTNKADCSYISYDEKGALSLVTVMLNWSLTSYLETLSAIVAKSKTYSVFSTMLKHMPNTSRTK